MKILVIGGSGFIGLPLVLKLGKLGYEITVVCRGKKPHNYPSQVSSICINRKDTTAFYHRFKHTNFDVIFDLAAFTARDVLQILELFGNSNARYIYVSSSAVYGTPDMEMISEKVPAVPISWHDYGRNKWLAEQELIQQQLHHVIVRPATVFGPGDSHKIRGYYFFARIFHQIPLLIPGTEKVRNNDVYIDDLVDLLVLCSQMESGTIINAGGIEIFTWEHYIRVLAEIMNKPIPPKRNLHMTLDQYRQWPHAKQLQFYHNAFQDFVLDVEQALCKGWKPIYLLHDSLKSIWQWLSQQDISQLIDKKTIELEQKLFYEYSSEEP